MWTSSTPCCIMRSMNTKECWRKGKQMNKGVFVDVGVDVCIKQYGSAV